MVLRFTPTALNTDAASPLIAGSKKIDSLGLKFDVPKWTNWLADSTDKLKILTSL